MRIVPYLPSGAKLMLVGEAPGEQEDLLKQPFVGPAGQELRRMMTDAEIVVQSVALTNVFDVRPQDNDLSKTWGVNPKEWASQAAAGEWPIKDKKSYLRPYVVREALARLRSEIEMVGPNCIVALGNTAAQALAKTSGIGKVRGTIMPSRLIPNKKMLITYHPSSILREWSNRVVVVADLMKAARESQYAEIRRLSRELVLEPTPEELECIIRERLEGAPLVSVDIETAKGQITCIGFSPSPTYAVVVPLWDTRKPGWSYYSQDDELRVWRMVRRFLEGPTRKLFQNGLYDVQYLYKYGVRVHNFSEDTMLAHHALYSELAKGLDFLGSIYTDEVAWKTLRPRGGDKFKRDE